MSTLFSPYTLRSLTFKNRIVMSPMCQYSARAGVVDDWHLTHLGSRAVGGVGLVMLEATGVSPEARISPGDVGLWNDEQVEAFKPIVRFVQAQGARIGVQLAHAGRKGSTAIPWEGDGAAATNSWVPLGPTTEAFAPNYPQPRAMTNEDFTRVREEFVASAVRARDAGFDVVELHFAHGYLVHEFLSPLVNTRADAYGGSLENRMRLALEITRAVRAVWPTERPLFARLSATDWVEGGWDLAQSVELAKRLRELGVDLIDCSTGGAVAHAKIPVKPGYQVPFAAAIRAEAGLPTGAVGLITEPAQAEEILAQGQADLIFLARALLREPYWALRAARELGVDVPWPAPYDRVRPRAAR